MRRQEPKFNASQKCVIKKSKYSVSYCRITFHLECSSHVTLLLIKHSVMISSKFHMSQVMCRGLTLNGHVKG